jgi:hypothetical protein
LYKSIGWNSTGVSTAGFAYLVLLDDTTVEQDKVKKKLQIFFEGKVKHGNV